MYPQVQPKEYYKRSFNEKSRSATTNNETHDRWAHKVVESLNELHTHMVPQFWTTLRFNKIETVESINKLLDSLRRCITYHNDNNPSDQIAIHGTMNVNSDNAIHYHILVRSTYAKTYDVLSNKIKKHNKKYGTKADIEYFDEIENVMKVTMYPFKLGDSDKKILFPNSGIRHTFSCYYFDGLKKSELIAEHEEKFRKTEKYASWVAKQKEEALKGCSENLSDIPEEIPDPISQASYEQEKERKRVQSLRKKARKKGNHHQNNQIDPKQLE